MKAIISLTLCSAILMSGSSISQSTSQKDSLEDYGLSENMEQRELNETVRQVRGNKNEPDNTFALYQQDDNDKKIQEIATHGNNEKRQVSVASAASSSVISSSAGQSVFVSKTNDICTKILGEMKALTEHAKTALFNLKSELSLGPQKGENYEENAAATSESLAITQTEIYSFVDRFPALVQAVIDDPSEISTVHDILTASIPADQISGSVAKLRDHILELLQVIREWLAINETASNSIQSVENYIASLQNRRFEILDDLVVHENSTRDYFSSSSSSSSSSASATVYPTELSNCEGSSSSSAGASSTSSSAVSYSNSQQTSTINESESETGVLDSSKRDLVVVKQFKTLRILCNAIRKLPDLLIELLLALKEGISSLHTNRDLCEKIKDHPIFSIPGFRCLLPDNGNKPPNAIAWPSPGNEYESKVQSTSDSSTSSASSSTSSRINYKLGEETINSVAAMDTAGQTILDASPSVISPWVRDSTRSTASASSSASSSSLCDSGDETPRRAFSSAVATASSADKTFRDTARSLMPSGLQGSTTSAASTSNSISSSRSSDFEYGRRRGIESLTSAIAEASSVAQTLPDRARSVISPWLQASTASASSTSRSTSSSGLSDVEYRDRSGPGALSSAVATASSVVQTLPDTARSVISPWVQGSTGSTSSASSSSASLSSSASDNEIGSRTGAISSAVATASSVAQTIPDTARSLISPWVQSSETSSSASSSATSSSSFGLGNGNMPARDIISSTIASATSAAQTLPDTARAAISPWIQSSKASASSTSRSMSSSGLSDVECRDRSGPGALSSAVATASSVVQTLPDTARSVISPWVQSSTGSTSSASSSSASLSSSASDNEIGSRTGAISSAVATASSVAQTIPDTARSLISPWIQSSKVSSSASSSATSSNSFGFGNGNLPRTGAMSSVVASASSAAQTLPDTARSVISRWIERSKDSSSHHSGPSSSDLSSSGNGNGLKTKATNSAKATASSVAQVFRDTTGSAIAPWIRKALNSGSSASSTESSSSSSSGDESRSEAYSSTVAEATSVGETFVNSPKIRLTTGATTSIANSAKSSSSSTHGDATELRINSQRQPCSKCGLFSCLCNHRGDGQHFHSLGGSSATDDSMISPSKESDQPHFVPIPPTSYTSSSASSASSSSTSEKQRISQQRTIPGERITSSSASSASATSLSSFDQSNCNDAPKSHQQFNSASAAATASAQSFSNTNSLIHPPIQISQDSSLSASSNVSSSVSNPASPSNSQSDAFSGEEASREGHCLSSLLKKVKSSCPLCKNNEQSQSLVERCSKCGLFPCLCRHRTQNSDHSGSTSLKNGSSSSAANSKSGHSYFPLPPAAISSSTTTSSSSSSSSTSQDQQYSPTIVIPSESFTSTSATSSSKVSQGQQFLPAMASHIACSSSRVPSISSNSLVRNPQLPPQITIPSESFRRSSASSSSTAYSSNANQVLPYPSPRQSGGYPSSNLRRCASVFPSAPSQIRSPSSGPNFSKSNRNLPHFQSSSPSLSWSSASSESTSSNGTPSISTYIPDLSGILPSFHSSSSSSSSAPSTVSPTSGSSSFSSYIPSLSHLVPNFNIGSSSSSYAAARTSSNSGALTPSYTSKTSQTIPSPVTLSPTSKSYLESSSNNPSETVLNEPSAALQYNDDDGRSNFLTPATYGFQSLPHSARLSAASASASGASSSPYLGYDLDDEYNESVSSRVSPSLSSSPSNIPFHQSTNFFVPRPSRIKYNDPNRRSSAFPTFAAVGYQHDYEDLPLKTYAILETPQIMDHYAPKKLSSHPTSCINSIPFILSESKINSVIAGSQLVPGDIIVINLGGPFSLIGISVDDVSPVVFSLLRPTRSAVTLNNGERVFQLSNKDLENDEECSGTLKRLIRCLQL